MLLNYFGIDTNMRLSADTSVLLLKGKWKLAANMTLLASKFWSI